jgi:hypothetical protein
MKGSIRRRDQRRSVVDRQFSFGSCEKLEPRGMLSSDGITLVPPSPPGGIVVAAPSAAIAAAVRIALPPSVPNGLPVPVAIGAVDAAGMPVSSFSGSVTLTSSDSAATLPASVALVNGRAVVQVTFRTAGPQTVTAVDPAATIRAATASTTVAQPLVAVKLTVMLPAQVRAGVPTSVTALAVDASGRPVPTFNGTATVTSSDPAASLPLIEVSFKNGRSTFQVTFATAGSQTVTAASLSDSAVSGTGRTTVIAPPVLASFFMLAPPRVVAGAPVSVAIVALDANKRPIPDYSGTATLVSSDPAATLPSTVTFKGGRAVARVTFGTPGSQTVSVWGGVGGDILATASTTVVAVPVVSTFGVLLPRAVPAGVPVVATVVALDAQGRPVPTFTGTASLASSDQAAKLPPTVTFVNGRALVRIMFTTLGEQTLTVTSGSVVGTGKTRVGEVTIQPVRG